MNNIEKMNLLVTVAKLYYEHNLSQQVIAEKTGFSRPYISKLINEARVLGIVEIKIHDPNAAESQLERIVRETFALQKVIIIPSVDGINEPLLLDKLAEATARYLYTIVTDNDVIGVSWGSTLYVCASKLRVAEEVKNISVVQMCGAISMTDKNIYATEIPKKFADAYKGTPYLLPLPAVVDDIDVKNAILKDKNINGIIELGKRANIGLFSVGVFGHNRTLSRAGYISDRKVAELLQKGAIADMLSRIINIKGQICDEELNQRTIGIDLEDLKNKKYSIMVSGGLYKTECMYAALVGGYANVLITDEATAQEIVKLHARLQ